MRLSKIYEGSLEEILAIENDYQPELVGSLSDKAGMETRLAVEMLIRRTDSLRIGIEKLLGVDSGKKKS
jgi:hypothetical protein